MTTKWSTSTKATAWDVWIDNANGHSRLAGWVTMTTVQAFIATPRQTAETRTFTTRPNAVRYLRTAAIAHAEASYEPEQDALDYTDTEAIKPDCTWDGVTDAACDCGETVHRNYEDGLWFHDDGMISCSVMIARAKDATA